MKTLTAILVVAAFAWLAAVKAANITMTLTVPNAVIGAAKTGLVVRTGNTNILTMSNAQILNQYLLPSLGLNNTNYMRSIIADAKEYDRIYNTNDVWNIAD